MIAIVVLVLCAISSTIAAPNPADISTIEIPNLAHESVSLGPGWSIGQNGRIGPVTWDTYASPAGVVYSIGTPFGDANVNVDTPV